MEEIINKQSDKPDNLMKSLSGQYGRGAAPENQVVIHTMPERFFAIEPVTTKTKRTGIFILAGGAILLIAIFAGAYFYFSKMPVENNNVIQPNFGINPPKSEDQEKNNIAAVPKENIPVNEPVKPANTVNPAGGAIGASSTEAAIPASETNESPANNTDVSAPAAASSTEANPSESAPVPELKTASDSDYDGLSDSEEALLGTDKNLSDSDADGFGDLSELLNLYNPAGSGLLAVNTGIERYISNKYGFLIYYPAKWNLSQVGGDDSIMIRSDEGQFFQIIIQDNAKGETIEEWYKAQFGVPALRSDQRVYKKGWEGVKSETGFIVYLMPGDKKNIFTLTYNLGTDITPYYNNIFNMMIGSLGLEKQ